MAAVLLAWPIGEIGHNDDWSYCFTAQKLAETGKLTFNGWATAMLGLQAYWGALFIKLFGFSFTVLRLSILPLAALCGSVAYGLGRTCGLRFSSLRGPGKPRS